MLQRSLRVVTDDKIVVVNVGEIFIRPQSNGQFQAELVESVMTMYALPPDGAYVGLQYPSRLYFRGILKLKVICGSVSVLGYSIKAGDPEVTLFSLKDSAALFISADDSKIKKPVMPGSRSSYYPRGYLMDRFKLIGNRGAIFELSNASHLYANWETRLKQNGLNIFPDLATETGISLFPSVEKYLHATFDHETGDRIDKKLVISEVLKVVAEAFYQREKDYVLLLAGGNGVGKSTALKYFVNRSLQRPKEKDDESSNKVIVVDLDPGQSEFTMSGCISIVVVETPLLGSNYSHLMKPMRCHYIGSCNVMESFVPYLDSIKELGPFLNNVARVRYPNTPVIINTMGLTNDIGFSLLAYIIKAFEPSDIIEIISTNPGVNYKLNFTIPNLKKSLSPYNPTRTWLPHFNHNKIPSCVPKASFNERGITAKNKRDLVNLMYLRYDSEIKNKPLIQRVCANNKLTRTFLKVPVICALCITDDELGPVAVGFGIVEGIISDENKEYLRIISPISHTEFCSLKEVIPTNLSLHEYSLRDIMNEALGTIPHTAITNDNINNETEQILSKLF